VFQIPGHYGESVLEGGCTDPDIFHPDRLAVGLKCCEQIAGTNSFRLSERKNVDAAQNLAGNSFP